MKSSIDKSRRFSRRAKASMHSLLMAIPLVMVLFLGSGLAHAQDAAALVGDLKWRSIGPAGASGRVTDVLGIGDGPQRVYAGLATGGLWKTDNNGLTWESLFDKQTTGSIGDVAVIATAPDTVWVGTGEANVRNSVSWGDGVYKSTDGGATWKNMGLRDSQHIGRIVIDPRNPDTVYVAAVGRLWGPNKERGVFKTTDGGLTWTPSLFIDENTGVTDLQMDPHDTNTLYAAAYQRRQTFVGGPKAQATGPGSGLYKTTDGGRSWRKLEKGLPSVDMGRIVIDVSLSNPNVLYAMIETAKTKTGFGEGDAEGGEGAAAADEKKPAAKSGRGAVESDRKKPETEAGAGAPDQKKPAADADDAAAPDQKKSETDGGGLFRSTDRGESWTFMNSTNQRPDYFSQIRVDPTDENRVYRMAQDLARSEDGGKTFQKMDINVHVDHHAMWINPKNSRHIVLGNDGGVYFSFDAGTTWDFQNHMAISQFYAVDVDMRQPYYVYGGTQDYCSWGGPSATRAEIGITVADWFKVQTGDGFQVRVDPTDHTILYAESQNGRMVRHDLKTGRNTNIQPVAPKGAKAYRWNWETPILISPHDPATLYTGGSLVFRSNNRGNAWTAISGELSTAKDGTITTITESPVRAGVLYAGTDDGHVHVTRDGGKTWTELTKFPKLAGPRWVSRVVASRFDEGTAFVTFDGHRNDDFAPHVYKTTNFGASWQPIHANLPASGPVRVIREDYKNPQLLFVGTEFGAFASIDGGKAWTPLTNGLPTVPVFDLVVHPRDGDLIAGTHGRSFYILDISPLQQLTAAVASEPVHLFKVKPAMAFDRKVYSDDQFLAQGRWVAENPPVGATIYYHLGEKVSGIAEMTIVDSTGRIVQKIEKAPAEHGLNHVLWNLRGPSMKLTRKVPGRQGGSSMGAPTMAALVDPGEYTAVLHVGGQELRTPVTVVPDSQLVLGDADRTSRRSSIDQLKDLQERADGVAASADRVSEQAQALAKSVEGVAGLMEDLKARLEATTKASKEAAQSLGKVTTRVNAIYRDAINSPFAPTQTQLTEASGLDQEMSEAKAKLAELTGTTIPQLERDMNGANLPRTGTGGAADKQSAASTATAPADDADEDEDDQ